VTKSGSPSRADTLYSSRRNAILTLSASFGVFLRRLIEVDVIEFVRLWIDVFASTLNLKSAVERGSFDQTMDEMDIVDPVDFTRKGIDFLVHFVHKVHDIQRIARRIRS